MSTNSQTTRTAIPLAAISLSQTESQLQRRKRFAQSDIDELAASIKDHGLINPILVRPINGFAGATGTQQAYELVAGERRYLAAEAAGLAEIDVTVRELDDRQVLEIQIIENLQRVDLHPLHEAEGYEQLMKDHGHRADELGDKIGKSKAYVYARLKLLALCKEARTAFYDAQLNASTALLIARIPVESLQKQALKDITQGRWKGDEPMSSRQAEQHIQDKYMLRLKDAPFDTSVVELVKGAPACGQCPKNTLAHPELFGDVKTTSAGVCTDPTCFNAKCDRASALKLERAKANGQKVITGAEAKSLVTWEGDHNVNVSQAYVKLDDECWDDPKHRTYRKLLGDDVKPIIVKTPKGRVIEVAERKEVNTVLKVKAPSAARSSNPQSVAEKKAKLERVYRQALYQTIREKHPAKLGRAELELTAIVVFGRIYYELQKQIFALWQWEVDEKKRDYKKTAGDKIPKLTDAELSRFLLDCCYVDELSVGTWSNDQPDLMNAAARRLRIDAKKIRADLDSLRKSKAKPAKKAAKKK